MKLRLLAVALVLALGLWLRARDLGSPGFGMDESGTLWAARGASSLDTVKRVYAVHGQSPLHYLLVRASTSLVGESEATVRLPSALAGALIPLLGYLALARAFGRRAGAIALVLLAIDPALVAQSRSARPYALAEAASLAALVGLAFSLETGSVRARLLLWGSAVVAVFAHALFFLLVPAVALGALLARSPRYRSADVLRDGALASGFMVPELIHVARLFSRRDELYWIEAVDPSVFALLLPRAVWVPCAVAVVFALVRKTRPLDRTARGTLAAVVLGYVAPGAAMLVLLALGANLVASRYLSLALVLAPALVAWVLSLLPRWLAPVALVTVVVLQVPVLSREKPRQEWREAAEYLDELAPARDEPIVLNPGFVEQNLLVRQDGLEAEKGSFVTSPFELRPGKADRGRAYILVPTYGGVPGELEYLERAVVPPLAGARSFCVVARRPYVERLDEWLGRRLPLKAFHRVAWREFRVNEFASPIVVARYEGQP